MAWEDKPPSASEDRRERAKRYEDRPQTASQEQAARENARSFLYNVGITAQTLAWIQIAGAVIVGLFLAQYTEEETHPYVVEGLLIAVNGAVIGVIMLTIGTIAAYIARRDAAGK